MRPCGDPPDLHRQGLRAEDVEEVAREGDQVVFLGVVSYPVEPAAVSMKVGYVEESHLGDPLLYAAGGGVATHYLRCYGQRAVPAASKKSITDPLQAEAWEYHHNDQRPFAPSSSRWR